MEDVGGPVDRRRKLPHRRLHPLAGGVEPAADVEEDGEADRGEDETDDAVGDQPPTEAAEAEAKVGHDGRQWRHRRLGAERHGIARQQGRLERPGLVVRVVGMPWPTGVAHGAHSTTSPTAVGSIRTSGASSEAYSTSAAGGSTRRSGNTRPSACGQYVPQWIG